VTITGWTNTITGKQLSWIDLQRMRERARRVYEVNSHIFEDEVDALTALGVVPLSSIGRDGCDFVSSPTPSAA